MTHMDMYWLVKLDDIRSLAGMFGMLLLISTIVSIAAICIMYDMNNRIVSNALKKIPLLFFLLGFILLSSHALIPSTKQAAAIYLVPKMVNDEDVKEIAANSMGILKLQTEKWIEGLTVIEDNK